MKKNVCYILCGLMLMCSFVLVSNSFAGEKATPIYPAGEQPIEGITAENLVKAIKDHGHKEALFCPDLAHVVPTLEKLTHPGDLVLTLGAGNINKEGERFLELTADKT